MSRPARLPSAFTVFTHLLGLREALAGLFRPRRTAPPPSVKLAMEAMEERVVLSGNPLPHPVIFMGSGVGEEGLVKAYNADAGTLRFSTPVFGDGFSAGVRVAAGDFTGDGTPDAVVASASGRNTQIEVLDGNTGARISGPLGHFTAYPSITAGGVLVATGDVEGDGVTDLITAAETRDGPEVKVFSGTDGSVLADFTVAGEAFRNRITLAAGDFTGSGKANVVVGGADGWVSVYDPLTGSAISGSLGRFQAFGSGYTGGVVSVAADPLAGDVQTGGVSELAVGTGAGTPTEVKVYSGKTGAVVEDIKPFGSKFTGGVQVALAYVSDPGNPSAPDIVVGTGPGTPARVKVFGGATGVQLLAPLGAYEPSGFDTGGVLLGASNDPLGKNSIKGSVFNDANRNGVFDSGETGVAGIRVTLSGASSASAITDANGSYTLGNTLGAGTYTVTFGVPIGDVSTDPTAVMVTFPNSDGPPAVVNAGLYAGNVLIPIVPETLPCITGGPVNNVVQPPAGAGGNVPGGTTRQPIRYADGVLILASTDLESNGFDNIWGQARSWSNNAAYATGSDNGNGWVDGEQPRLVRSGSSLVLITNALTALYYDGQGTPDANGNYSSYTPRFSDTDTVAYDPAHDQFVVTNGTGSVLRFSGFGSSYPTAQQGAFVSYADPAGNLIAVVSWNAQGRPTEVQESATVGGSTVTESFLYSYLGGTDPNAGKLSSVTLRQRTGAGAWATVRAVSYQYYDGTTGNGNLGDLERATIVDGSGNLLDQDYYRYYTSAVVTGGTQIGYQGGLKYALGTAAYARLKAALGGTDAAVDGASDSTIAPYADNYFEYDFLQRVTKEVAAGEGCSACSAGQGTYSYAYATSGNATGFNSWQTKTVETLPDGTTNTVYTNAYGEIMLKVYTDASSNNWMTYYEYDTAGRVILQANPSAVTGFNDSYADLVHFVSGNAQYLSDSSGEITAYTYGATTTATTTTAGDAAGYLKEADLQQGETGTPVPQETFTYIENTVGGVNFFYFATDTKYRNANGTGGETTSYAYTFLSGTNHIASLTTTLPAITTAENGSGTANTTVTVYDSFGNPVWTKDQSGFINYTQYDTLTGAVVKTIIDVDTTQTSTFTNLPTGWNTPTGGGLQLTTTYAVDNLGRVTKETDPNGTITYTVYDDAGHEVRTYAGWNTTTNAPTGPTTVTRTDRANDYTETLTMSAAPAVSGGVPTGTEAIANLQSLARSYTNDAGQVIYTDVYYNLGALAYSISTTLGAQGVNFDRTQYQYDVDGNLTRTVDQLGTITRIVYDGQGRKVSAWVGTDDTPTTGFWSPTNLTGTNMVQVAAYQYDGGGVGDGNLTLVTQYPGGSAAAEVTQTWYDWRDRAVATKSGVQTSEGSGVNRPLTVYTYDNRNEVTETQVYAADGVAPTISGGVLSLTGVPAADLRAQGTTSYDEQGQVYRTDVYDVNPSTGSAGTNTLHTLTWHDARGNVIETQAPGGLVTKDTYDGAGRLTAEYATDGHGGTSYALASSVTSDAVLAQTLYTYDGNGNLVETATSQRFDTDAENAYGALGTPTTGVNARVSYVAEYYDLANRPIASVDVGTNGGTAWTRPSSVPTGSSTVLVTTTSYSTDAVQDVALTGNPTGGTFTLTFGGQTTGALAYNASAATVQTALQALTSIGSGNVAVNAAPSGTGWEVWFTGALANTYQNAITGNGASLTGGTSPAVSVATVSYGGDAGSAATVTDPAGEVTRTYTDAEGRVVRTIQDFTNGVVTGTSNATTGFTYNAVGTTSVTAYQSGGGVQVTAYAYGVSTGTNSTINSNDIVGITEYPDGTSGLASSAQEETITVNALGQPLTSTDRNGSVHTYTYDVLGRQVSDAVTTLGSGVDGGVRLITTAYDGQGNPYLVTSYNATSGGSVVNQVQRVYNGLGQLVTEYQAQSGTVNTSSTLKVQYAYAEMPSGADQSRLTSITYPDGYVLTYNYASGLNSTISRLSSLSDTTGTLEAYKFLGLGTIVERDHPLTNVNQTVITGGTGDAGDKYVGLDRFGRVVDDQWVNTSTSTTTDRFQYGYDADSNVLWRQNVVNTGYGELYTYTGENALASFQRGTLNGTKTGLTGTASASQSYVTDGVGNFTSVTTNGTAQTRTANAQNEYTSISGATTPTYDSNGNMTGDETGRKFVYDAWNRLVAVKNSGGTTLETFTYDGMNRRATQTVSGTTTALFYSADWQVLEEKVGSATTKRYVWSPVYVDALILRDRDTNADGTLDERLWVQQDANWNVTALLDGGGSVVERYVYDPYGVVTIYDASYGSRGTSSYGWDVLWQGMKYDSVSGSYKSRGRTDISPTLGRPFQLDPIGFDSGDVNFYRWEDNGPTNYTDPSGWSPIRAELEYKDPRVGRGPNDRVGRAVAMITGRIDVYKDTYTLTIEIDSEVNMRTNTITDWYLRDVFYSDDANAAKRPNRATETEPYSSSFASDFTPKPTKTQVDLSKVLNDKDDWKNNDKVTATSVEQKASRVKIVYTFKLEPCNANAGKGTITLRAPSEPGGLHGRRPEPLGGPIQKIMVAWSLDPESLTLTQGPGNKPVIIGKD